jgi:hypothetical protein
MGNKVTVITRSSNRVLINTNQRQQVKSVNIVGATDTGSGINTLAELQDIDASDADNNEVLVYDEASGKYVVKELPIINGGTF